MFARVSIYDDVDLDAADALHQWLEASAPADPFRELPGYPARSSGKLLPTLLDDARAQVPEAIRPVFETGTESVGLYEIVHRD